VVGKAISKVKTAVVGPAVPESAENAEIDRTVLGGETHPESKGMITQISDKVKGILPAGSTMGPSAQELDSYEAGLIKAGLRTEDETHLHPEVEQKGMLASLTEKVTRVFSGPAETVPGAEQPGVLSKISQLVFGTDSSTASTTTPSLVDSSTTTPLVDSQGIDHTLCSRSFDSVHPTKIGMDIADNRSAVPLAGQDSIAQQTDVPVTQAKSRNTGRSPKKSPKKMGRRASKKNVYRVKSKSDTATKTDTV